MYQCHMKGYVVNVIIAFIWIMEITLVHVHLDSRKMFP